MKRDEIKEFINKAVAEAIQSSLASLQTQTEFEEKRKAVSEPVQMLLTVCLKYSDGSLQKLGDIIGDKREFRTGSKGYYISGKVEGLSGDRYQITCNAVLIGSKPKK